MFIFVHKVLAYAKRSYFDFCLIRIGAQVPKNSGFPGSQMVDNIRGMRLFMVLLSTTHFTLKIVIVTISNRNSIAFYMHKSQFLKLDCQIHKNLHKNTMHSFNNILKFS